MSNSDDVRIELMEEGDFPVAFDTAAKAFGHQARDGIWMAVNPGWDTPEGLEKGGMLMEKRWRNVTTDRDGNPNTMFLKATVPDPKEPTRRVLAGMAIWEQCSMVEGRGVPLPEDRNAIDLGRAPNERERRFISQAIFSLHKPRLELAKAIAATDKPALLALDICAVNPAFQRRGIAGKLVEWGLREAERRGGIEAVTEASDMGRPVYARVGMKQIGDGIMYNLDEEFADRDMPPNVFMRSQPPGV